MIGRAAVHGCVGFDDELGNDSNDWMSHVNPPEFKTPAEAVDGCRVGGQETTAIF